MVLKNLLEKYDFRLIQSLSDDITTRNENKIYFDAVESGESGRSIGSLVLSSKNYLKYSEENKIKR